MLRLSGPASLNSLLCYFNIDENWCIHNAVAIWIPCKKLNTSNFLAPTTFGTENSIPLIFWTKPTHPAVWSLCIAELLVLKSCMYLSVYCTKEQFALLQVYEDLQSYYTKYCSKHTNICTHWTIIKRDILFLTIVLANLSRFL